MVVSSALKDVMTETGCTCAMFSLADTCAGPIRGQITDGGGARCKDAVARPLTFELHPTDKRGCADPPMRLAGDGDG